MFCEIFIPGPCASVWANTNACIKGSGMILLRRKVGGEEGRSRLIPLRLYP